MQVAGRTPGNGLEPTCRKRCRHDSLATERRQHTPCFPAHPAWWPLAHSLLWGRLRQKVRREVSERDPNRDAPEEVDAYLAALQCVREQIHAMAHGVTERVSNRIPMFRLHRDLLALSAHARHLSLHTLSRELAERLATRFPGLTVSGATIQFTPEHPVPQEVVEAGGAPLAQPVRGKGRLG